jgi:hypothetical protein
MTLVGMDDRVLALCELSTDLLFNKIPKDRLAYYVDSSLEAGRIDGDKHIGADFLELAQSQGIGIVMKPRVKSAYGVMLRGMAIFGPKGSSIEVHEDSLEEMSLHCGLDRNSCLQLHLVYEYFHYLEFTSGQSVSERLESVETFRIFGLSRKAKINKCSEVAAHAFAKTSLGLPWLPNGYDYMYLIGAGKMKEEVFGEKALTMEAMLK